MSDYRAAIIGCGRMGRGHAHSFLELGIPLVAGADIAPEALDQYEESFGMQGKYADFNVMLKEVRPDLVSVVTAEQLHCAAVVAAAEAGVKGIICEKPMAMNLPEADRMIEACRANGAVLTVSHQRYYSPQYARARDLIRQGAIGKVRFGEGWGKYQCLMTDHTHTINMLMHLMGEPKVTHLIGQIDGHSDYVYFGHRCEEAGNAYLAFDNGTYAYLIWGRVSRDPDVRINPAWDDAALNYHAFAIHGETGTIEVSGDGYDPEEDRWFVRILRGGDVEVVPVDIFAKPGAIALEVQDVIKSIETGAPHPLSGENGRATMEIMMGIYESSRRRGIVRFPADIPDNPFLAMVEDGTFPS